jgi:hypothetical protein
MARALHASVPTSGFSQAVPVVRANKEAGVGKRWESSRHLVRLAGLFGLGLCAFLVVRWLLMPEGFGVYGHYRAGALADNRERAPLYAGQAACVECHTDVGEARAVGRHARLSCEGCHGPLASHAVDPGAGTGVAKPDGREGCVRCHARNSSRPPGFPQVVVVEHAEEGACTACHQPHQPGLS